MIVSEFKRLRTVKLFETLNFSKNQELNNILKLAAEICDVTMVSISLMGKNTQFIKCKIGLDIEEGSRENSFCKYLMDSNKILVIPDTLKDSRFAENPAVTSHPAIRFYAGAPLISATGYHVGSLCVYGQLPQLLTNIQRQMLEILSTQAMHLMELEITLISADRRNHKLAGAGIKAASSERKLRAFFNSSALCHTLISLNFRILDFNKAAAIFAKEIYHSRMEVGKNIMNYVSKAFKTVFISCFKMAIRGKLIKKDILIKDDTGVSRWWEVSFEPITNDSGDVINVSYNANNINEQKLQEAKIMAQNNSLRNIAYIQSHEYRKPVASIMGLMHLIKTDDYRPDRECLMLMEKEVEELDRIIRQVVNEAASHKVKFST